MGIDNPESTMFVAKACGAFIAVFFGICFYIGYAKGEEFGIKPLNCSDKFDIGYISPVVEAPVKVSKVKQVDPEEEAEKRRLQKLRNELERMKLEKQLRELRDEISQPKKKPRNEPVVETKTSPKENPLFNECVNTLVALGEKKSSAINIVKAYFENNPNTTTVNDFILGVFKK